MLAKGIVFKPSAPYSQEKNRIAKRNSRILIERIRCIIIEREILDEHWPKVFLAMTYISNLLPTSSLNSLFPFEASFQNLLNLYHLSVLGLTVYIFIYEVEHNTKSAKWISQSKCGTLVGYDGKIIYHVYLYDKVKVIRIKDLKIFENVDKKKDN